jgi:hypothetical protein
VTQILHDGSKFGHDNIFPPLYHASDENVPSTSTESDCRLSIVEYDLPGVGFLFEPTHLRGLAYASFLVKVLKRKGFNVISQCFINTFALETGIIIIF